MECLQLPEDLIWDGKSEPNSPSSELFSISNSDESWFLEDNFAKDVLLLTENPGDLIDESLSLSDGELLCEFEYNVKEEEQWMDGKYGLQHMDYSPSVISPTPTPIMKVQNPYEILMELEKFYGGAELTQLTPPQTPPKEPLSSKDFFDIIQQTNTDIQCLSDDMTSSSSSAGYSSDSTNPSTTSDAVQIVDEILRTKAKDLPDWINEDDDDSMFSMSSSSSTSQSNNDNGSPSKLSCKKTTRRVRPYGRGTEDKKSRKKEQNKNAATRYRQKKKEEMKEALDEESKLLKINDELSKNASEYKREIKYLKKLIIEFHKSGKK